MTTKVVYIYRVYFPASDKSYVGQTDNIERRMFQHLKDGRRFSLVHKAFQKYDVWEISKLCVCSSREEANDAEIRCIKDFNTLAPNGYNLNGGGDVREPSAETRIRLDNGWRGKKRPEHSKKLTGGKRTAEQCETISKALMGHEVTSATRKKLVNANLGKKYSDAVNKSKGVSGARNVAHRPEVKLKKLLTRIRKHKEILGSIDTPPDDETTTASQDPIDVASSAEQITPDDFNDLII